MTIRKMVGTLSLTAAMAMTAFAHHSFTAEFDNNKPVKLQGKLKEMKWSNPHGWVYLDVETNGKVETWALETGAANSLIRRGWKKEDLVPGTILKVDGYTANLLIAWSLALGTLGFVFFGVAMSVVLYSAGRWPVRLKWEI